MSKFIINGAKRLSGKINVSGSKNAALPIIFASLVTKGVSILYGVPDISDVHVAIKLVESLGAHLRKEGDALYIDTENLEYSLPDEKLVSSIRASSYLLGATLARFGKTHIQSFGGCNFDNRPIDMHIDAMLALGAQIDGEEIVANNLSGADIHFKKISVGATVNALILCSTAWGVSRIYGYAREPHVTSLADYLVSAGADITFFDDHIRVVGRELHGGVSRIIPDMIEAGTYIILSSALDAELEICGIDPGHLSALFEILRQGGAELRIGENSVMAKGKICKEINLATSPYPGFPTDLQPQCAPLLATALGGRICEGVWKSRFGYLSELSKFGVEYSVLGDTATIFPSKIHSAKAKVPDLRAGAALIITALISEGGSVIEGAEIVGRGYEGICEKLRGIGADIIETK